MFHYFIYIIGKQHNPTSEKHDLHLYGRMNHCVYPVSLYCRCIFSRKFCSSICYPNSMHFVCFSLFFLFSRPLMFRKCRENAIAAFLHFFEFDSQIKTNPFPGKYLKYSHLKHSYDS